MLVELAIPVERHLPSLEPALLPPALLAPLLLLSSVEHAQEGGAHLVTALRGSVGVHLPLLVRHELYGPIHELLEERVQLLRLLDVEHHLVSVREGDALLPAKFKQGLRLLVLALAR